MCNLFSSYELYQGTRQIPILKLHIEIMYNKMTVPIMNDNRCDD